MSTPTMAQVLADVRRSVAYLEMSRDAFPGDPVGWYAPPPTIQTTGSMDHNSDAGAITMMMLGIVL